MKKLKILEITNYSAGICGVFARVKEESIRLKKLGYDVMIFSSDFVKGKNEKAKENDEISGIKIKRFKARKLGGESYMSWDQKSLIKEIIAYDPDLIITHSYRHTHSVIASKVAEKLGKRSFLVTHAPFGDDNRSLIAKLFIKLFHDPFIGKKTLKRFDKVIAITKWEYPYLKNLGVKDERIIYIPNGIPEEFFKMKKAKEDKNKILFLGRISEIKDLETLILAMKNVEGNLEIVGPAEEQYLQRLKEIIRNNKLESKIGFSPAIFDVKKKIRKIDSAKIFVLPSKREGMPQALIEAMAREKIVIASDNLGAKDLIKSGKNGFLFKIGNSKELGEKLNYALSSDLKNIRKQAKKSVEKFSWDKIIREIDRLFS